MEGTNQIAYRRFADIPAEDDRGSLSKAMPFFTETAKSVV
jgi:hypothetical protein